MDPGQTSTQSIRTRASITRRRTSTGGTRRRRPRRSSSHTTRRVRLMTVYRRRITRRTNTHTRRRRGHQRPRRRARTRPYNQRTNRGVNTSHHYRVLTNSVQSVTQCRQRGTKQRGESNTNGRDNRRASTKCFGRTSNSPGHSIRRIHRTTPRSKSTANIPLNRIIHRNIRRRRRIHQIRPGPMRIHPPTTHRIGSVYSNAISPYSNFHQTRTLIRYLGGLAHNIIQLIQHNNRGHPINKVRPVHESVNTRRIKHIIHQVNDSHRRLSRALRQHLVGRFLRDHRLLHLRQTRIKATNVSRIRRRGFPTRIP